MRICVVDEMVYYYIIRFMADHVKCNFRDGLLKLCCILYLDVFCFVLCLFVFCFGCSQAYAKWFVRTFESPRRCSRNFILGMRL